MYLKFVCSRQFPELGRLLAPNAPEDSFDWDSENVYEWMYVDLPQLDFSLNISREHGWAKIADDLLDVESGLGEAELKRLVTPGPVYVFGWNRAKDDYVDLLPNSLAEYFAARLSMEVFVYSQRINVTVPDSEPIAVVKPHNGTGV